MDCTLLLLLLAARLILWRRACVPPGCGLYFLPARSEGTVRVASPAPFVPHEQTIVQQETHDRLLLVLLQYVQQQ